MRRNLHHRLFSALLALLFAVVLALPVPAQSGDHDSDHGLQIQVSQQDASHPPASLECHTGACSGLILTIALSTVFAVNNLPSALPPSVISAPDSYKSALDTPPPRA